MNGKRQSLDNRMRLSANLLSSQEQTKGGASTIDNLNNTMVVDT